MRLGLLFAALLLCLPGARTTHAQAPSTEATGGSDPSTPVSTADGDKRRRAYDLFQQSTVAYQAGNFERAAELLREAHLLHPDPSLLYNLARALDAQGDLRGAVDAYERFLSEQPGSQQRGLVERRVTTLREQIEAQDRAREKALPPATLLVEPEPAPAPVAATQAPPPAPVEVNGKGRAIPWIVPWAIAGVGVVALGVGGTLGLLASNRNEDAAAAKSQREATTKREEAEVQLVAANALLIGGGVVAAAGVLWGVLTLPKRGPKSDKEQHHAILAGPQSVHVRLRF